MAHETSVTGGPFIERLRSEIHAAHHAGETRELEFLEKLHALTCVRSLLNGNLLGADDFAGLSKLASDLLDAPVPRELRRPIAAPPVAEEDLQLGTDQ